MLQLDLDNALSDGSETGMAGRNSFEIALASRQRKLGVTLQVPSGLVVSSDDEVRRNLAQVLRECALAPVLASTVAESAVILPGHGILIVICDDFLDDGQYEDIVKLAVRSQMQMPVVVVSRTGDWPQYITAICAGAFDYLTFPPIPGDLHQTIRNALLGQQLNVEENGEAA